MAPKTRVFSSRIRSKAPWDDVIGCESLIQFAQVCFVTIWYVAARMWRRADAPVRDR
jgi:hypothetical protein